MIPFSAQQSLVIEQAVAIARASGAKIYAVGGIVRDALLGRLTPPTDVDLVVAGGGTAVGQIAHQLATNCSPLKCVTYPKFGTAELVWADFTLDLTTARKEVYPYAGANPIITPASLEEDLYRRDFTVNALACELQGARQWGEIIDLFGGRADLQQGMIRAIRTGSFAEDPRRMFRAVRLAVRLGFTIEPTTAEEIEAVCRSGLHDRLGGSRLRAELLYILKERDFAKIRRICQWLGAVGAWRCVDPHWQIQPDLIRHLIRLKHWWQWFGGKSDYFLLGLEVLLWQASRETLTNLDMPFPQCKRLESAHLLLQELPKLQHQPISQIYDRLQGEDLDTLILGGAITGDRTLWRYLTTWRHVQPLLTGGELLALGYPKGKHLGQLLHAIRSASLDGVISNKDQAIAFAENYWRAVLNQA